MSYTKGPWLLGEYDDSLGYDCMTGGVRAGPVVLDGADYGQKRCKEISPETLEGMMADARLISAAPDMAEALRDLLEDYRFAASEWDRDARAQADLLIEQARAALAKAGV